MGRMLRWFAIASYNPSLSGCKEPSFALLPVSVGMWVRRARLFWPRLGWAALHQMLQLDGKTRVSLQLCGFMGMALLHAPLHLLGPAGQPGHVFLRRWQRCKRAKRNMFAKPRLRAQVLSLRLIYHRPAGVAGLSPKSWSIKGHLVRHWQGYGCRETWKTDAIDMLSDYITVHFEEKEFQFLFTVLLTRLIKT